jgi:hypothetical protein
VSVGVIRRPYDYLVLAVGFPKQNSTLVVKLGKGVCGYFVEFCDDTLAND